MDSRRPNGHWGGQYLRNALCYNSRLSAVQFSELLRHFCLGTPALSAATEISKRGDKVSRQTVSKHYQQIGLVIFRDREVFQRFTWWPAKMWPEGWNRSALTYKQLMYLRDEIVYTGRNPKKHRDLSEPWMRTDKLLFVRILRAMSRRMNGISRPTFESHLGRACLLASFLDKNYANLKPEAAKKAEAAAQEEMYGFLVEYFIKNPWLWSVKMSARRRRIYWGNTFYEKEAPLIAGDDATQAWHPRSREVSSKETEEWADKRVRATFDDAVDLSSDPHRLVLTKLFRPEKKRKKRTSRKK